MTKMVQIRNVPDDLHRALKSRAAMQGISLSDLILEALSKFASLPSEEELRAQLSDAQPFSMQESSAKLLRKERDAA